VRDFMHGRMPMWPSSHAGIGVAIFVLSVILAGQARARASEQCLAAAQHAATETGVPYPVLLAISQTESGRRIGDTVQPWPWTLNIRGDGQWLETRSAALTLAQASVARGVTLFDVGCFQINYRWHGQHFASLDQMLDPDAGAVYAAQFLQKLYAQTGDWSAAAGAYHSRTPVYAARYRERFDRFYVAAQNGSPPVMAAATRINTFPLLRSGAGQTTLGSLVPFFEGG